QERHGKQRHQQAQTIFSNGVLFHVHILSSCCFIVLRMSALPKGIAKCAILRHKVHCIVTPFDSFCHPICMLLLFI
ncbi:MAG: hypothetical protein ACFNJR_06210, partial [Segatella oulorum]|uniref:hypothetical protein n=1 Tax=Segatella oulorum TaxID=28136 RepID=UPI0036113C25